MTMQGMILGLWLAILQRKLEEGKVEEVIQELEAARKQLAEQE